MTIEKIWLTTKEAAFYIGHSISFVKQCSDFIEGIHYFKPTNIRLYNKNKLDEWVRTNNGKHISKEWEDMDKFISEWKENTANNRVR